MSEITNIPPSRKQGKVVSFGSYTDRMLIGMKDDIGLELRLPELRAVRDHFRRTLRRDAYLDELYMLDRLISARRLTRTAIDELFTDSDFIAETYADMQQKHLSLSGNAKATCSSLATLAGRYLARAGKTTSLTGGTALTSGELADVELRLRGHSKVACTDSAAIGRRDADVISKAPAGSLLVLVYPWGGISPAQLGDALRGALAKLNLSGDTTFAFDGSQLQDDGIIEWLCSHSSGAYIDLSTLNPIINQVGVSGLELLAHPLNGAVMAAMPASRVNDFMAAVYEKRLWTGIIGGLSSDGRMSVNCGPVTLSYPIAMLSQLAPCEARAVTLRPDKSDEATRHAAPLRRARTDTDILVSQRLAGDIAPQDAHGAAMCAIADCVAAGANFSDVALSFKISTEPSPDGMSRALSLVTALYRVQLEYCCPDTNSSLTGATDEPSLIVAAAARLSRFPARNGKKVLSRPALTIPARAVEVGTALYLLEPLRTENGLTDHEDARRMWQYVAHLTASGAVMAAVAVGADGVDAAMSALLGDSMTLSPAAPTPSAAVPGAILIACCNPISGTLLGTIDAK